MAVPNRQTFELVTAAGNIKIQWTIRNGFLRIADILRSMTYKMDKVCLNLCFVS